MVQLNRIYTRGGDQGQTSLGDGTRVPKTHPRLAAYGTVDELAALLGMCWEQSDDSVLRQRLTCIQDDLLDLGAELCLPSGQQRLPEGRTRRLEAWIDERNDKLPALASFVLAGSLPPAGSLHLARTVCRRAERLALGLHASEQGPVNERVLRYLNRLSDLLFVEARVAAGDKERLWTPGGKEAQ